jgi:hypothetical protein
MELLGHASWAPMLTDFQSADIQRYERSQLYIQIADIQRYKRSLRTNVHLDRVTQVFGNTLQYLVNLTIIRRVGNTIASVPAQRRLPV